MNYTCPWQSSTDLILPRSSFVLSALQEQASDKHQIPAAALAAHPVHFQTHSWVFFFFFFHTRQQWLWGKKCVVLPEAQIRLATGFGRSQMSPFRLTLRSAGPRCAQDSLYPNNCTMQSTATPLNKKIITFLTYIARLTRNKTQILPFNVFPAPHREIQIDLEKLRQL